MPRWAHNYSKRNARFIIWSSKEEHARAKTLAKLLHVSVAEVYRKGAETLAIMHDVTESDHTLSDDTSGEKELKNS